MKVLTYNTLFGGFDGARRERYEAQMQLIREVDPDVLLLQEARGFEAHGSAVLLETEQRLAMRGFLGLAPHTGQNTAIFVKPPVQGVSAVTDSEHFHHARLTVTAQVPGYPDPVNFISVHLCPNAAHIRRREAAYLLNEAAPGGLALVGGDFNTISPHDGVPPDLADLQPHFRLRYTHPDGSTPDGQPLQFLESAGWVELGHQAGDTGTPTVPTTGYQDTEFATFRSDYFLATQRLAKTLQRYQVIRNAVTDKASDHYPVLVEFQPEIQA
jgi:endonuclease/exonuclease/phosphatase family metal-dependent hydrolase